MAITQSFGGVALEFKKVLESVAGPDRENIWHLTSLARDNLEEAQAIAKVIENDIRSTRPSRKLTPFYVLDSIVKNVGSPYNLYFGFTLFKTFFDAYAQVDGATRRSMEAMLKTWKQPVPNTLETDPVFSIDITRPIETALQIASQNAQIKTQTAYIQQPHQIRQQLPRQMHALPPRPPGNASWGGQGMPFQPQANGYMNQQQFYSPPEHTMPSFASAPYQMQPPVAHSEQQSLLADIEILIHSMQHRSGITPWDGELRGKIDNVNQLQHVLRTQQLPPAQLRPVQTLVASLSRGQTQNSVGSAAPMYAGPPAHDPYGHISSTPQYPPQQSTPQQQSQYSPPSHAIQPSATPQPISQPPAFDPGTLAALAASINAQRRATPQAGPTSAALAMANGVQGPALDPAALHGLYQRLFTPSQTTSSTAGQHSAYAPPPGPVPSILATLQSSTGVRLDSASLKIPRPELYRSLWHGRSPCRTCGRRFDSTIEGKARKARHLDYHFRVNMRRQDASRGATGPSRGYFMGEQEWIQYREIDNADEATDPTICRSKLGDGANDGLDEDADKERPHVRVPSNKSATNKACPICQEEFKDTWRGDLQDWVWPDCVKGRDERYFHDSCMESYREDEIAAREREAKERDAAAKKKEEMEKVEKAERQGSKSESDGQSGSESSSSTEEAQMTTREESVGRKRKAEELEE